MEQLCAEALREYQRVFLSLDPSSLSALSPLSPLSSLSQSFPSSLPPSISFPSLLEQPKPQHSYIGLIAMAILSSPERKMVLSEVYEWIMGHYTYFRSRGSGWRNSIRHNLSLNDCFVKAGRAANGKGHYWAIHPACLRDFERGDFRRRRAQRKVRRHMGLSVTDCDTSDDSRPASAAPLLSPSSVSSSLTSLFSLNTFIPRPTPLKDFSIDFLLRDVRTSI